MSLAEWAVESFIRSKKDSIDAFMSELHPDYIEIITRAIDQEIDVVSLLPAAWVGTLRQKVPTSMLGTLVSLIENQEKYADLTKEVFCLYHELLTDKRGWLIGQVNRLTERINGDAERADR